MRTADQPSYRSCPPICPTGCTKAVTIARIYSTAHRLRLPVPPPLLRGMAGRNPGQQASGGTDEVLPPPPPCGRQCGTEEGRQAAGPLPAGSAALVMPQRQRRQNDGISCRPPAGGGHQGGAALRTAPAGRRGSSGGQLCGAGQNHDRRGAARLACVFVAPAAKTAHLSSCFVAWGLVR